jgi:hypothetical protein
VTASSDGPKAKPAPSKSSDDKDLPLDARIDGFMRKFETWRNSDKLKKRKGPRLVRIKVLAYWPASEWDAMAARWPQLVPEYGDDHGTHRRNVDDMLQAHSDGGADIRLAVAPLTVDGLLAYAAETESDPTASETRAAYAQRLGAERQAIQWPPALRQKCWCGSGKSFRECSATHSTATPTK